MKTNKFDKILARFQSLLAWIIIGFLIPIGFAQLLVRPQNSAFYALIIWIVCPLNSMPEWVRLIAVGIAFTMGLALGIL
jgi:hypothetical protein